MPYAPQVGTNFQRMVQHTLWWHGVADDDGAAGAHNAGLLTANAFAVGAQNFHVVEVDAGDDGAIGVDDVGRIQPAAQADFQDHHIEVAAHHDFEDGEHGEFEVAQRHHFAI